MTNSTSCSLCRFFFIAKSVLFATSIASWIGGCQSQLSTIPTSPTPKPIVAKIDNQPIFQQELLDHLYTPQARQILDELILTYIVRREARQRDISNTTALIQQEYEQTLNLLAPDKPRYQQEALYHYMLKRRGYQEKTYKLILERQALLKQMVDPNVVISETMLRTEFEKQFGRRIVIRQLMVSSFRRINEAQQRISQGESFIQIIQDLSEDQITLANNGLLGPFSNADSEIPEPVRQAAFSLKALSDYSKPFPVYDDKNNQWWCLIQLERILPRQNTTLDKERNALTQIIHDKIIRQRVLDLQESLKQQAHIEILDHHLLTPTL